MTKAKRIPSTIFDEHVARKITILLESYLIDMWKFVYSDNSIDTHNNTKDKNRSSTKTDELHKKFVELFSECFGNYKDDFNHYFHFNIETDDLKNQTKKITNKSLDLYGKKFNVDIELINSQTGETYSTILLKAPMTSILKNRFNMIDSQLGEALRFLTKEKINSDDNNLLFVNFVPNESFSVNKKNNSIKIEKSNTISLYSSTNGNTTVLEECAITDKAKTKISEIGILYDLTFNKNTISNLNDLKKEIASNSNFIQIDPITIDYLRYYVFQFLSKNSHIPAFQEILSHLQEVPDKLCIPISDSSKEKVTELPTNTLNTSKLTQLKLFS